MKTQEEIEQLAEKYAFNRWGDETLEKEAKFSYTYGYTQCQEDMADKKYTEDDAWITMKEGDITVNFIPMPEFDNPKYPEYPTRAQQVLIQIAEECFRKYPNNKELYDTDELKDAYKAGVIDGFKEAQNYNPLTKKQDNE